MFASMTKYLSNLHSGNIHGIQFWNLTEKNFKHIQFILYQLYILNVTCQQLAYVALVIKNNTRKLSLFSTTQTEWAGGASTKTRFL